MKFYAPVQLGPTRSRTPEGFLLCEGVRLARTGDMLYGAGEVPIDAGPDGFVHIERTEDEVFRAETLASANGKAFTVDHPPEDVNVQNWRRYAAGSVLHPRRGTGDDAMFLMGDILITDAAAIRDLEAGKKEISLGYDAQYEPLGPGRGRQRNIIVNHAALVDKGRCGPACAIGDSAMTTRKTILDTLAELFATKDANAIAAKLGEGVDGSPISPDGGRTTINIHPTADAAPAAATLDAATEARFKLIEDGLKGIKDALTARDAKPDKDDEDDESCTKDSVAALLTRVKANGEILSPGFKVPTLDSAAEPATQAARLCDCQRRALDEAYRTDAGKKAIDAMLSGRPADFGKLTAATVDMVFNGAAAIVASANDAPMAAMFRAAGTFDGSENPIKTMNARNRDFWAKNRPAVA